MDSDVLQKRFAYIVMTILVVSTLVIAPSAQSAGQINLNLREMSLNEEPGHNSPPKVDEIREYSLEFRVTDGEPGSFQIAIETCSEACENDANWVEHTRDLDGDGNVDSFDTNTTSFSQGHHTLVYFNLSLSEVGSINIRASLDPDDEIAESNPNDNNHKSVLFLVEPASGEADLFVSQMGTSVLNDGSYESSSKIEAGDSVLLDIQFGNGGDISSSSSFDNPMKFSLFFHEGDVEPTEEDQFNNTNFEDYNINPEFPNSSVNQDGIDYYYIAPTDPDKMALTEVTWDAPMSGLDDGFYTFTYVLDADNIVDESNENNNELSIEFCFHGRSSEFCELSDLTAGTADQPRPFTAATGPKEDGDGSNYPEDKECSHNEGTPCISGTTTYILFKIRNEGSYTTHDLPDASVELSTRFCGEADSEEEPSETNCDEWDSVGEFQPFTEEFQVQETEGIGPKDQPIGQSNYLVIEWDAPNIPGYWDLKLFLDSSDVVREENEWNNEIEFHKSTDRFFELVERKADLQISSFTLGSEVAVQNYTTTLNVWVDQTALGTLDAVNVGVTLDIDGPTEETSGHIVIPGPGGGPLLKNIGIDDEPLLFGYEWVPKEAGIYNITATVNPPSNDTYTHVVEWDDDDDPPNENNQLIYQWIEVMPILPDLVIAPGNSWLIPLGSHTTPITDTGLALVGVDSLINFTIKNEGYRDLLADESFILRMDGQYGSSNSIDGDCQTPPKEISLSGPLAMGESILVQIPYVFCKQQRYEFHLSVDYTNQVTEIFEGICNFPYDQTEYRKNCQRFEVYAKTVVDTWISSNLSMDEEMALLGNDHHLHFQIGMDFLSPNSIHEVYFSGYASAALTGTQLIFDGTDYMQRVVCNSENVIRVDVVDMGAELAGGSVFADPDDVDRYTCQMGQDANGMAFVTIIGDNSTTVSVDLTVIWTAVGMTAGDYEIEFEIDTGYLEGRNLNSSNDALYAEYFVNTFTTDLRIIDVYVEPGEVGINIVYVEIGYPTGEIEHLGGVGCVATSTCIFVNVSIYVSDFALGALSESETFVEHLGLVMIMEGMIVGETKILEFEWVAPSGSYVIVADVDPTDLINEYIEYNNRLVSALVKTSISTDDGDEEEAGLIPSPPLISVILLLLIVSLVRRRV